MLISGLAYAAPIQFPANPAEGQTFSTDFANYQFLNTPFLTLGKAIVSPNTWKRISLSEWT